MQTRGHRFDNGHRFGNQIGVRDRAIQQHVLSQHQHPNILPSREGVTLQCAYDEVVKRIAPIVVHAFLYDLPA